MNAAKNHSLQNKNGLSGMQYGIPIFLFFAARFFILFFGRNSFSSWMTTPYVITYKLGFISRAFIGSVIALFTDYLTLKEFKVITVTVTLVLLALISFLLGKVIAKVGSDNKNIILVFVLLFISAPVSMTYLLEAHFGRLEAFLLIFTLTGLLCLKNPRIKWAVPLICFVAISTHPGYLVTYMPGLAIPMLYEIYRSKYSKKSIVIFFSGCIILIGFFVYFQLFSRGQLGFANAEEMGKYLSQQTDMKVGLPMLYLEYFAPFPQWVTEYVIPLTRSMDLPVVGIALLTVSLPLIIIFGSIWIYSIRNAGNNFLKFIFILCLVAPLAFIPAAVFGADWDREWAPVINCQFIFLFYFVYTKEIVITDSLKKVNEFFDRHTLLLLCILTFGGLAMFSNIGTLWMNFMDKSIYNSYFGTALSNFDYMLG
ncbi:MAG: hypothetical protein WCN92_00700 [Eubacteriales bacterium]